MSDMKTNRSMAVLGATGYIGRSLVAAARERGFSVVPFSRDTGRAMDVLAAYGTAVERVLAYDVFGTDGYDIVINATGVGSPTQLARNPLSVFKVTHEMDVALTKYQERHPDSRIFNLSSGAIYGISAGQEIMDSTLAVFSPSSIQSRDCYGLAKIASEAWHRALSGPIVDLRVFAFVSRFLDADESFFIAEVARSLRDKTTFRTSAADMVRDYATADTLLDIVEFLYGLPPMNDAFDVVTAAPVSKFELLERLKQGFNLAYEVAGEVAASPTGEKSAYYSRSTKLAALGYSPKTTSLENIMQEMANFV